jgi:DNA-binding transcriptional LysR family regulator
VRVEVDEPFIGDEIIGAARPGLLRVRDGHVRPREIAEHTLLVREPGSSTRRVSERARCRPRLSRPNLGARVDGGIKRAAREGLGIAFLSRYAVAEEIERGELTSFRIAGRPPMERTLDVARLARRPFTPSERGFLDTLRTCCAGSRSLAAAVLPEAHG